MPKNQGVACAICLAVDDSDGMLVITLEHGFLKKPIDVTLCRRCVGAIHHVWQVLDQSEKEPVTDEPSTLGKPADPGSVPGDRDAGAPDLVAENQPGDRAPEGDRGKPKDAA